MDIIQKSARRKGIRNVLNSGTRSLLQNMQDQKFQANGKATLEVYSQGDPQASDYECSIWVPVQEMHKIY